MLGIHCLLPVAAPPALLQRILPEQQLLEDESHAAAVLGFVPDEDVRADIEYEWSRGCGSNAGVVETRSQRRWRQFRQVVEKAAVRGEGCWQGKGGDVPFAWGLPVPLLLVASAAMERSASRICIDMPCCMQPH